MTPALLNAYYNITNNTGTFAVSQAVYESDNQYMSPSDLSFFNLLLIFLNKQLVEIMVDMLMHLLLNVIIIRNVVSKQI